MVGKAHLINYPVGRIFEWYDNPDHTGVQIPSHWEGATSTTPANSVSLLDPTSVSKTLYVFQVQNGCYSVASKEVLTVFELPTSSPDVYFQGAKLSPPPFPLSVYSCNPVTVSCTKTGATTLLEWWGSPNQMPGTLLVSGPSPLDFQANKAISVFAFEHSQGSCPTGPNSPPDILSCYGPPTQVNITIHPIGVLSGGATICSGEAASLSVSATGFGPWNGTLSDGTIFSSAVSPFTVSVSPSATTSYTIATLSEGGCNAVATDLSGGATVIVNIAVPKFMNCPSDVPVLAGCGQTSATASWTPPTSTASCGTATPIVSSNFSPGSPFPLGATTVTYTATLGNQTATCSFNVIVGAPPSTFSFVGCPSNIGIPIPCGQNNSVASWVPPTISSVCPPTVTSNYSPGATFPIGTTTVTYTATLGSQIMTCNFTVTVSSTSVAPAFTIVSTPILCNGDKSVATLSTAVGGTYQYSKNDGIYPVNAETGPLFGNLVRVIAAGPGRTITKPGWFVLISVMGFL